MTTSANWRAPDCLIRRRDGVRWSAVHQHVDVALHQSGRRQQDQHCDEECGGRVGTGIPGAHEQQPEQHGQRAEEVAPEVQGARPERRAVVLARGAPAHERPAEIDRDHDRDDGERVPRCLHRRRPRAHEVRDRTPGDEAAGQHEDRSLRQRAEMLGLPVPVLVRDVGRPDGDADGEEREQRGDQIRPRVRRLGHQAEAVRRKACAELQGDQRDSRADRDQGRSPLRMHAASETEGAAAAAPSVSGLRSWRCRR
jgi:hypothetical protein